MLSPLALVLGTFLLVKIFQFKTDWDCFLTPDGNNNR